MTAHTPDRPDASEEDGESTDREQMLRRVLVAFDEHDLDAIMSHFAEDCVFETPRGPDRWGSPLRR
jgi:ketosteroid isomerase-like protein